MERIDRLAACHPAAILLREKDLSETEYETLARQVMEICATYEVPCILHTYVDAAARLNARAVHLPLPAFRALRTAQESGGMPEADHGQAGMAESGGEPSVFGVSCHSLEDALEAERLGCAYLTAGHIFHTNSKRGRPGRGLDFLREVCEQVDVPVVAIGGIGPDNIAEVRRSGAAGACVMSSCMQCWDPKELFDCLQ